MAAILVAGCDPATSSRSGDGGRAGESAKAEKFANPVGSLKLASKARRWDRAWEASAYLLGLSPESGAEVAADEARLAELEPETLALIARAAHETGRAEAAADYLRWACRNEAYVNPRRVRQTMIAMIAIGQYYEGLDFLEQALLAQPEQHETRRWLFDFYVGADDRVAAIPHGRRLVLERKFDLALLKALANTERRTLESDPLDKMVERNPDDKRPLLGKAKASFDKSEFEAAIELLREIVAEHPGHLPSQALLGQTLAAAGELEALESWADSQSAGIEDYPGYWIALGDWARARGEFPAAARCFAQAARSVDPDVVQIWTRLATLLPDLRRSQSAISAGLIEKVNARAQQLGRFQQLKDRFVRTGEISRAIALQIAEALEQLGRLWEAEAWASMATTLPEDDSVDVDGFRRQLVGRLGPETEWRVGEALPDFSAMLSELPLPEIEQVVSSRASARHGAASGGDISAMAVPKGGRRVDWKLDDEAEQRGLAFWGRTGDRLDEPGIMLYETLGCGGGTIDFDLDGWADLYLAAAGGQPPAADSEANALFRNQGGRFVSATEAAGVGDRGFGQGVAVGDVNEDGFPDLLVLNYGPNRLLVNNGDGTFSDRSAHMPPGSGDEWSSSGAIADIDRDGISDLVVVNYCAGLGPVTETCPMEGSEAVRSCTPMLFPAMPDRFLKGNGDGTFRDATELWQTQADAPGRGLGVVVGDLDGKLGNEVFVANDMTGNHYWSPVGPAAAAQVAGDGADEAENAFTVSESAMLRGLGGDDRGIAQGSMGIASGDLDRDGDLDLYVTNFDREYNTLHTQSSSGLWQDRTGMAGLVSPTLPLVAFGTEAIDVDLDGQLELVVTNGHVDLFSRQDERALYQQPAQIFQRAESGRYEAIDLNRLGGYLAEPHVGRGLWTLDVDRDGRLDFAVTHQTEPVALIVNHSPRRGQWLRLQLRGRSDARDAVGAVVRIRSAEGVHTVFRTSGSGYQCSNDPALHVGLGEIDDDRVEVSVTWPNGGRQTWENIPVNQETLLVQAPHVEHP